MLQSIYEGDDAFKTLSETSFSYRVGILFNPKLVNSHLATHWSQYTGHRWSFRVLFYAIFWH